MAHYFGYQIKTTKWAISDQNNEVIITTNYLLPIINLSAIQSVDISPLEHSLKQCFVHKNKHIKKDIAIKF